MPCGHDKVKAGLGQTPLCQDWHIIGLKVVCHARRASVNFLKKNSQQHTSLVVKAGRLLSVLVNFAFRRKGLAFFNSTVPKALLIFTITNFY
jgi:hypothetical protein